MKLSKILVSGALAAAVLPLGVLAGGHVSAEGDVNTQESNLPVKIDKKTGVISSNGPVETPTAEEGPEVAPTKKGESTSGVGTPEVDAKGKAVLDDKGNLKYAYETGAANTEQAKPELSKEEAEKLAKQDEEKDPSLKEKIDKAKKDAEKDKKEQTTKKPLPKTSAVK